MFYVKYLYLYDTHRGHDLRDGGVQRGRRGPVAPPGRPAVGERHRRVTVLQPRGDRVRGAGDVVRRQVVLLLGVGGRRTRAGGRARPDRRVRGYLRHLEPGLQRVVRRTVRRLGRQHVPRVVGRRGPGLERRLPDDVEDPGVAHHDRQARHDERAHEQDLLGRPAHGVRQYGARAHSRVQAELAPLAEPRGHQRAESAHPRHRHHHAQVEPLVQPKEGPTL